MKAKTYTLYISNTPWKVKLTDKPVLVDEKVVYGCTEADVLTITVGVKGLADNQVKRTLIHEIIHATIDTTISTYPDDEEQLVHALEGGLFSIIRDDRNKWLLTLLN